MWPFNRRLNPGDPNDLFKELSAARLDGRTDMDRYREFRAVFLGSEQGKRVLSDVLAWCHMGFSSIKPGPIDPYDVVRNEGARQVGLKITTAISAEPKAKPTQQNR